MANPFDLSNPEVKFIYQLLNSVQVKGSISSLLKGNLLLRLEETMASWEKTEKKKPAKKKKPKKKKT